MSVNLYYTQKVRGFQSQDVKYSSKSVEIHLKRTKHQCPHCGSGAVTIEPIRSRIRWLIKQAYGFRDREYNKIENLSET